MRQALTLALQSYEGAMVIVSHDRYLLRATTDDLYLVHDHQVAPFDGDLLDYYKWLTDHQKALRKEVATQGNPNKDTSNSASAKKEQKRRDAEFRTLTAPIRKKITQLETKLDKLNAVISDVENQLAESSLYEAANKAKLTELLAVQATSKSQLEEVEMDWMAEQETLEAMEQEFNS